jgi:carbon monoxide dehydrogenase subunit G
MRLQNSFEVTAPVDAAWRLLNDVPRVLPCIPGAELVEIVSENAWKAKLHVKLGPISLQFLADVSREEIDERAGRVVLATRAREAKGRGSAEARIESAISSSGAGTTVDLFTDLELRGAVAQYGRIVVTDVASTLTRQFADCLARKLSEDAPATATAATARTNSADTATPAPLNGLKLFLAAIWRSLLRRGGG